MKYKFFNSLLLIAVLFVVESCSKDFLERPPEGQLSEPFKDSTGIAAFANGAYLDFVNNNFIGGHLQKISELMADQLKNNFSGDDITFYNRNAQYFGAEMGDFYQQGYRVIHSGNIMLENLAQGGSNINYYEGEGKFLRGVGHFELVRMFAQPYGFTPDNSHLGIPLRVSSSLEALPRSTVKQIYDQVIADLQSADSLLPATPADGKYYSATKWAAEAYLAKVYFQMNDFTNAFKYADMVINSNKFQLDSNYSDRFSLGLSKESILRIAAAPGTNQPASEVQGSWRSDINIPYFYFTDAYFNAATSNPNDVRDTAFYSTTLQPGFNSLRKYNKDYFDYTVLHLTEMKLIRAEAGAEIANNNPSALATAIGDINDILNRASGFTGSMNIPIGSTAALVISTARTQHELEMVGEGNRLQEIKRIGVLEGTNIDRRGSPWDCNGFILPFPALETASYPGFVQNPTGGCF
ncbi:RagB/SusD family nutrient uptake outer membrane protein [Ferruginibacter albus]|uniref:RagB/SusD family nutrient uptake outer membrane protein n=1 Tax=Ferruginibacter albus TaxID=2875540 RepID=UPI001CC5994C|nr:RagB/SusD family nutrient uptake outer membrane protein [Ferruginibacter albus]UAY51608.1 RagB/SusD family nutrient uptake outer membrane protein [Ferruginibacter albus]